MNDCVDLVSNQLTMESCESEWVTVSTKKKGNQYSTTFGKAQNPVPSSSSKEKKKSNNNNHSKLAYKEVKGTAIKVEDSYEHKRIQLNQTVKALVQVFESQEFRKTIENSLMNLKPTKLVLLGIGSFSESLLSLVQFALGIYLSTLFYSTPLSAKLGDEEGLCSTGESSVPISNQQHLPTYIFEPSFTELDIDICRSFGLHLLPNLSGKYSVDVTDDLSCGDETTTNGTYDGDITRQKDFDYFSQDRRQIALFFMPHCPYGLYSSLLWRNWHMLDRLIILGNSFESYALRRISKDSHPKSKSNTDQLSSSNRGDGCNGGLIDSDMVKRVTPYTTEQPAWTNDCLRRTMLAVPLLPEKSSVLRRDVHQVLSFLSDSVNDLK